MTDPDRKPVYAASARSRRQARLPKTLPSLAGALGIAFGVRALGVAVALAVAVVAALATLAVVRWALAREVRRSTSPEALLGARGLCQLDSDGQLRDLNHRTADEISRGPEDDGERMADCIVNIERDALRLDVAVPPERHRRRVDVAWATVESAELVTRSHDRCVMFLTTVDGARYRVGVTADAERVGAALATAGVEAPRQHEAPRVSVGDRVRVRDGREGRVVAIVPRRAEPGHYEVFVDLPHEGVGSWDSSAVRPLD